MAMHPEPVDILDRLRAGGECGDPCRAREARSGCLCATAADEIERLRGEVAKWRDEGCALLGRAMVAELKAARHAG